MEKPIRKMPVPVLVSIGDKTVSMTGMRPPLVEQHLKWHLTLDPRKHWCKVECMARTMFHQSNKQTREGVRKRVARTFTWLLERHLFMLIEYGAPRRAISALKLFDPKAASLVEKDYAEKQIERMKLNRELNQKKLEQAAKIIGLPEEIHEDSSG